MGRNSQPASMVTKSVLGFLNLWTRSDLVAEIFILNDLLPE
jgi:hypothetical protein